MIAVLAVIVVLIGAALLNGGTVHLKGGDYACGIGFEGLRVKRVKQVLDLGETAGMGGAYYSEDVAQAVREFQHQKNLPETGETDFATWNAMGFTREEWELCGTYCTPSEAGLFDGRERRIELMIERAHQYLGDPYVIGASGPPGRSYGLDCSGLVIQALYAAGVAMDDINPVSHAQPGHEYESRNLWLSDYFTVVDYEERVRGDLIFYGNAEGIVTHIAIYLGGDEVIESWPGGVQISPVIDKRHSTVIGVKRVFR